MLKKTCPNCGEPLKRVRIVYGLPTAEYAEQVARAEVDVVLAGCLVGPDDPKWACAACREPLARQATATTWAS